MSRLDEQRDLNRGFGDGMSRAFEFAATPLVFGLLGHGVDLLLGTTPWFAIGLALFAVAGMFLRVWFGYDHEMRAHESGAAWSRDRARTETPADAADVDLWSTRRERSA